MANQVQIAESLDTLIRVNNLGKKYVIGHQQKGRSQRLIAQREALGRTPDVE